jgi:RNA polymerase sigma-70 factor (ECF subfamily)
MTRADSARTARGLSDLIARAAAAARPDADLLDRFVRDRDGAAFAELVRRHGPAVLAAARRATGSRHDAEDVFQATFLVLARKAAGVRRRGAVGGWLFAVAGRLAARARADARRRSAVPLDPAAVPAPDRPPPDPHLHALVDAELARLPARLREALVLCYLQGRSRDEAAAALGCTPGSVKKRLEQGRDVLRGRLARRGVTAPGGVLLLGLLTGRAAAAVSPALADTTARAAVAFAAGPAPAGAVSSSVLTLATGGLKAMMWTKLKVIGACAAAVGLTAGGGSVAWQAAHGQAPAAVPPAATGRAAPAAPGDDPAALQAEVEKLRRAADADRARAAEALNDVLGNVGGRKPQADPAAGKTAELDRKIAELEKQLADLKAARQAARAADLQPPKPALAAPPAAPGGADALGRMLTHKDPEVRRLAAELLARTAEPTPKPVAPKPPVPPVPPVPPIPPAGQGGKAADTTKLADELAVLRWQLEVIQKKLDALDPKRAAPNPRQ